MEPNTQPKIEEVTLPTNNKNKKVIIFIFIFILIVIIVALILFKFKLKILTDTTTPSTQIEESQKDIETKTEPTFTEELQEELNTAIIFDNEADLKEIDKVFE